MIDLDLFFWIDSDWLIYVSQKIQCSSLSLSRVLTDDCLHLILIRNTFLSACFRLFLFLLRMAQWLRADGAVLKYSLAFVTVIPAWLLHHHYTWWMIVTCQVHHLLKCQKICRPLCSLSLDYIISAPLGVVVVEDAIVMYLGLMLVPTCPWAAAPSRMRVQLFVLQLAQRCREAGRWFRMTTIPAFQLLLSSLECLNFWTKLCMEPHDDQGCIKANWWDDSGKRVELINISFSRSMLM